MPAKAIAGRKVRSTKTATGPARNAPTKKPSASSTAASAPSRKRKAADDADDIGGPRQRKTRVTALAAQVAKSPPRAARPARAPAAPRILNSAPTQVLTVYVFGTGDCGELGLGPKQKSAPRPRLNKFLDPASADGYRVVQLACGGMHVVALTEDGRVVTWGVNDKGALGRDTHWEGKLRDMDAEDSDDDSDDDVNPLESTPTALPQDAFPEGTVLVQVAAGDSCSLALTNTGSVYGWGTFLSSDGKPGFCYDGTGNFIEEQRRPRLLPGLKDITQIACGSNHALALDAGGNVWAWGVGEQRQLGRRLLPGRERSGFAPRRVEVARNKAKYIASGPYHSFAVDGGDHVWAWGLNSYGEAGNYDPSSDSGSLPYPTKVSQLGGKGVELLDGGGHHSVAVTAGGQCFVWGRIDGGQLGVEFTADQLADETLVVRDESGKPRICTRPVPVSHIGEVAYASCASGHTIFITKEGKAYSAGFGFMGQLGHGDEEDVEVARQIEAKAVRDKVLTWAGAGGQFSLVAEP
ncbi:RCC1/BLIP-II [Coniochaeta sp. PMI_546]|nr:RCC1/BLIP-II [Coniochaeta sp. PMI_546]